MIEKYQGISDEALISRYRSGEAEIMDFLLDKYKNLVRKRANALFLLGGDTDDLIQEGMIGLFKAIRDFDVSKSSFYSFAMLCINRQLYTAIESASRKKHIPLNSYVSLSGSSREEMQDVLKDELASGQSLDPEQMLLDQEAMDHFEQEIKQILSPMEQTVLQHYLSGMNYRQIAEAMERSPKMIDNALQRIRTKVQKLR